MKPRRLTAAFFLVYILRATRQARRMGVGLSDARILFCVIISYLIFNLLFVHAHIYGSLLMCFKIVFLRFISHSELP